MSTNTQETFTGFASAQEDTRELPKLNCIGRIGSVGEAKVSANGVYVVQPITIEPTEAGKKGYVNLLYRPDWLRPGFDPRSLEGDGTLGIVYKMHIGGARDKNSGKITQLSTIAGLAGSEENFNALAGKIFSAVASIPEVNDADEPNVVSEKTEAFIRTVQETLTEFVNENNPDIGYYSVQKRQDTGELDANGKKVKVPVAGQREVNGFFFPNRESHKRNFANAASGKSVMAYTCED